MTSSVRSPPHDITSASGFARGRVGVDAELVQDFRRSAAFGNALEARALRGQ